MKKIWMRVGMEVELTDAEYERLLEAHKHGGRKELEGIFLDMIERATPSGETYFLQKWVGGRDFEGWGESESREDEKYEISVNL